MPFNKSKALEEAAKLVSQKRLSQAIKQYLAIVEQDPADLSLLNTVGDLCVRDGNIPGALRQFYKLGAAYAHEGFDLKAIAIYKKIAKLDTHSIDPLIKLAELYSSQGLSREAREQYGQAIAFSQSHSLPEKAIDLLGRLIALDPENAAYRVRLGELHEASGRTREASVAFIEAADVARRQKNAAAESAALAKALHLDPRNPRVLLLEARMAVDSGRFGDAANLLDAAPELSANREATLIRLEACLGAEKLDEAEALTVQIYRDDPADFEAIERFVSHCLQVNNPDAAIRPIASVVDLALERRQAASLTSFLQRILQAQPRLASTLEFIGRICERAELGPHAGELLEPLAAAFARAEQWAFAGTIYRKLIERGGDGESWQALLNEALAKQAAAREDPQSAEACAAVNADEGTESPPRSMRPDRPLDPAPAAQTSEFPPSPPTIEDQKAQVDFSSEWEEYAASHSARPEEAILDAAPPLEEEERAEIRFYLEYGFFGEARAKLQELEAGHTGHHELAEFWSELPNAQTATAPEPPTGAVESDAPEISEAPEGHAALSAPELAEDRRGNLLDGLRRDIESSLNELQAAPAATAGGQDGDSSMEVKADSLNAALRDLLAELEPEQQEDQQTPEVHYNLGIAFREMGLLDEAVGEFQRAAHGADRQTSRFVETSSLLGACFMEKGMPALAARWYPRALESTGNTEETTLGLNYELGLAYEQSGDAEAALERFSEVYSMNIDYRDVAEKIRSLQHKG